MQDENSKVRQIAAERDDAIEAARRSEAHAAALASARGIAAPGGALAITSSDGGREPLQPLQATEGRVVPFGPAGDGAEQPSRTALVHKLELTERRIREQAHEMRRMVGLSPSLFYQSDA